VISLIWAQAANGVIGRAGTIPWELPEDMASFRDRTMGATVVMGRATWESLPARFRPLPGRRNLVLTHRDDWAEDGAERVASIDAAIERVDGDLWVIGGGQAYEAALPHAHRLVVTDLEPAYEGDTFAPQVDPSWRSVEIEPAQGWNESRTGLRYRITTYAR
jgi:dihydrofolate reductase